MPHIIVEHSKDIEKNSVKELQVEIKKIMNSLIEGNFDPDQCKCRAISFDEYFVGQPDQSTSSFIHITIKILSGRTLEVRKKLAQMSGDFAQKIFEELKLPSTRCDISVDIVEMDRDSYKKIRVS